MEKTPLVLRGDTVEIPVDVGLDYQEFVKGGEDRLYGYLAIISSNSSLLDNMPVSIKMSDLKKALVSYGLITEDQIGFFMNSLVFELMEAETKDEINLDAKDVMNNGQIIIGARHIEALQKVGESFGLKFLDLVKLFNRMFGLELLDMESDSKYYN